MLRAMSRDGLRVLAALAALLAVALVAVPVFGVDPSPSSEASPSAVASSDPSAEASQAASPSEAAPASEAPPASDAPPSAAPQPASSAEAQEPQTKPDKAAKPDKAHAAEHPVKLTGIVGRSSDEEGDYTLVVGLKVYRLSAGPKWWWGDANPLAAVFGKTVTIDGEQEEGSDEVDVLKIDGKAIREPGRPPWAGGWKVVGPKHPGWAQWKVDKAAGKGHGRDAAPGQLKKADETP
jgi:hypothetical protein